ncbi:MAG TPA: AIR synthase-related protein [Planctomycetota bacterium]
MTPVPALAAAPVRAPSWLADLVPAPLQGSGIGALQGGPVQALALAVRGLGRRRELARRRGLGTSLGIDMVNAAVAELLARGALPRAAALHVEAADDAALAEGAVAGIVRGCRAHGVEIACGEASVAPDTEHVSLVLVGGVIAAASTPAPGWVVLALRRNGLCDVDFEWAWRRLQQLELDLEQPLPAGDRLGDALLAPQACCLDVLRDPLRQGWPVRLVAVGEGGLAGSLAAALPAGVGAELDLTAWPAPEPFPQLLARGAGMGAAASACSLGCPMLVVVPAADATRWLEHTRAWNEPAHRIGELQALGG